MLFKDLWGTFLFTELFYRIMDFRDLMEYFELSLPHLHPFQNESDMQGQHYP